MRLRRTLPAALLLLVTAGCGRSGALTAPDARIQITVSGGEGRVQAPGIDCGEDCETRVDIGTRFELSASPLGPYSFGSWSGGPCSGLGASACSFVVTEDAEIEARFGFALTVLTTGDGVGVVVSSGSDSGISCGTDCEGVFAAGDTAILSATVDAATDVFGGWIGVGACSAATPCLLVMDGPTTITARFRGRGLPDVWWQFGGAANNDTVWGIDVDDGTGDVLVCGNFEGTFDFGSPTGAVTSLARDGFIVRRSPSGATSWDSIFRDPDDSSEDAIRACRADGQGGVVFAGRRTSDGTYDIDGDQAAETGIGATTSNTTDGFTGRLSFATGAFDWISSNTGNQSTNQNEDDTWGLALGAANTVWASGDISTNTNAYLQRYALDVGTATQNPSPDAQFGGTNSQNAEFRALACDDANPGAGDVVAVGYLDNQFTWGTEVLTSPAGSRDVIVARANPSATPIWATSLGGDEDDEAEAVAIDAGTGRIAVTGRIDDDVFLAVLDEDGGLEHLRIFSGPGFDSGRAIAWATSGELFLVGELEDGADLGFGPVEGAGGRDAFAMRFDASFEPLWLRVFGGSDDDKIFTLSIGPDGAVWLGGEFRGSARFGRVTLQASGTQDAFAIRVLP